MQTIRILIKVSPATEERDGRGGERLRVICKRVRIALRNVGLVSGPSMYVCNCNGIRERDAHAAISRGARKPAEVFRHCQASAKCAKCVCDLRRMIQSAEVALRYAAE